MRKMMTAKLSFGMVMLSGFAGAGLLLASLGIHGNISFAVGQQQEMGLQITLGARRRAVTTVPSCGGREVGCR